MSNGGRVHGHEKNILPDKNSTLLIVGYQAAGSLGRRLLEGEKNVLIQGEKVRVAAKVEVIYGYSAHMDSAQLLEFVGEVADSVKQIFVVMGEPSASSFLVQRIRDYVGAKATAPTAKDVATIEL
jgi:metallo-beta-lactamase family protein